MAALVTKEFLAGELAVLCDCVGDSAPTESLREDSIPRNLFLARKAMAAEAKSRLADGGCGEGLPPVAAVLLLVLVLVEAGDPGWAAAEARRELD